jgi:hypothetical protein
MCTGGEYRGVRHDRHLNAASGFQIGVSRSATAPLELVPALSGTEHTLICWLNITARPWPLSVTESSVTLPPNQVSEHVGSFVAFLGAAELSALPSGNGA